MMQPPRQIVATSPRSMSQPYSSLPAGDLVEPLCVGDDLRGVEGCADLVDERVAIDVERSVSRLCGEDLAGCLALLGVTGQRAGEGRLGDAGHRHAELQRVLHGPAPGALLLGRVDHDVDERLPVSWST